jgi:hypothetical protein
VNLACIENDRMNEQFSMSSRLAPTTPSAVPIDNAVIPMATVPQITATAVKYRTYAFQEYPTAPDHVFNVSDFTLNAPRFYDGLVGDTATSYSGSVTLVALYDMGGEFSIASVSATSSASDRILYGSNDGTTWMGPLSLSDTGSNVAPLPGPYQGFRFYQVAFSYASVSDLRFYDSFGQIVLGPASTPTTAMSVKGTSGNLANPVNANDPALAAAPAQYDGITNSGGNTCTGGRISVIWDLGVPTAVTRTKCWLSIGGYARFWSNDGLIWANDFTTHASGDVGDATGVSARYWRFVNAAAVPVTIYETELLDTNGNAIHGPGDRAPLISGVYQIVGIQSIIF